MLPSLRNLWRNRFNRALLIICCLLIIILALVVPLVDVKGSQHEQTSASNDVTPEQAARNASAYAVIKSNFPDPCLIKDFDTYYAFATRPSPSLHVQVASAVDIANWTLHEGYDAMPELPFWVYKGGDPAVWAPQVVKRRDQNFVLFFSASHYQHPSKHCIGAAVSSNVMGPYTPLNDTYCNFDEGGAIDPTFYRDAALDMSFVIYKNDGNAIGSGGACGNSNLPNTATTFHYQIVDDDDYVTPLGPEDLWEMPVRNDTSLLTNSEKDGPNIESPQLWEHYYTREPNISSSTWAYHLIYNSGCYADESYRINHIVCWRGELMMGKPENATVDFRDCSWRLRKDSTSLDFDTLLRTGSYPQADGSTAWLHAPGGPGVDAEGMFMVFHADLDPAWYTDPQRNLLARKRGMFVAELEYWGQMSGMKIKRLIKPVST